MQHAIRSATKKRHREIPRIRATGSTLRRKKICLGKQTTRNRILAEYKLFSATYQKTRRRLHLRFSDEIEVPPAVEIHRHLDKVKDLKKFKTIHEFDCHWWQGEPVGAKVGAKGL
jgi:hypothetical protein